mgnify:CR=1 FL=1
MREYGRNMDSPAYMLFSLSGDSNVSFSIRIPYEESAYLFCNMTLSITHEAESRASASWSQHSSIVSHIATIPYKVREFFLKKYFVTWNSLKK